jgi:hypothetical protein
LIKAFELNQMSDNVSPRAVHHAQSQLSEEDTDFSFSPAGGLMGCLNEVPDISVESSILGPGHCLLNLICEGVPDEDTRNKAKICIDTQRVWLQNEIERVEAFRKLDLDILLAVRMYTIKTPIPFYIYVNKVLNHPSRDGLEENAPYMRLLIRGLRTLESAGYGVVTGAYRGMTMKGNERLQDRFDRCEEIFQVGGLITFAAFTSVTVDPKTAEKFGDHFFLHFLKVRAVDVSCVSAFPDEQELVIVPPGVFKVEGVWKLKNMLTVSLRYHDQPYASYLTVPETRQQVAQVDFSVPAPVAEIQKICRDLVQEVTDLSVSVSSSWHLDPLDGEEQSVSSNRDEEIIAAASSSTLLSRPTEGFCGTFDEDSSLSGGESRNAVLDADLALVSTPLIEMFLFNS